MKRRGLCWLVVLVLLCTSYLVVPGSATAVGEYYGTYTTENLKAICEAYNFKEGYYWSYNETVPGASSAYTASTHKAYTVTSNGNKRPGEKNYKGYSFGGSECYGFAEFLGYKLSGLKYPKTKWKKYTTSESLGDIRVGDIVRYDTIQQNGKKWMHTAVALTVNDDGTFYVIDANGGSNNIIHSNKRAFYYLGTGYTNAKTMLDKTKVYVLRAPDNVYDYEKKSFSGVSTSGCTIRATCYSNGEVKETISAGKTLNFVGVATNSEGETWYKMENGCFVYSGHVTGTGMVSELFTITGNFKVTRSCKSKQMPTSSSQNVKSLSKGDKVEVTRFVTNEYGNIWAQLKDGSYVHFCDKGSTETHLTYIDTSKMADETSLKYQKYAKSGSSYVKQDVTPGNLVVNSTTGIYISGTVKTQAPILTVVARVANGKNQVLSSPMVTVRPPISLRSFSVHTATAQRNGGSKVNITEALTFRGMDSKNDAGPYRFELAVQLGFEYGGKTYKLGSEQVVDSYGFYVGKKTSETVAPPSATTPKPTEKPTATPTPKPTATPTPKPTATPTPKPTAAPVTKRLPGDVNGDGRVSYADLLRLAKYLSKWKNVSINEANANCNGDAKISYADLLRLAKYLSGWKVTLE